jgi:hypothetical protein
MCAECEMGRLRLPLRAFVLRSVVVTCPRCSRRYCSQLSGPLNMVRNWLIAALGTVLGGGLALMFFGRWGLWLGGLGVLAVLDAICNWLLHRRNVATRKITLLPSA